MKPQSIKNQPQPLSSQEDLLPPFLRTLWLIAVAAIMIMIAWNIIAHEMLSHRITAGLSAQEVLQFESKIYVISLTLTGCLMTFIIWPVLMQIRVRVLKLQKFTAELERQTSELKAVREVMVTVLEDTKRARAEAEVARQAVFQLAAIVESSSDAIIGKKLDGTITSWNHSAEKLYGYTEKEAIGQNISMLFPKDLKKELPHILKKVMQGETVHHYETVRVHKNGTPLNVSISISPIRDDKGFLIGAAAISRDITQQKREQEKFKAAVESAPNGMLMVNSQDKIVLTNSCAEKLFGYQPGQMAGRHFFDLLPLKLHTLFAKGSLILSLRQNFSGTAREITGLRADGTEVPLEISFSTLVNEEGEAAMISLVDITDRKKSAQAMTRLMQELAESNQALKNYTDELQHAYGKVKELDDLKSHFIVMAAHELRTPIASIKGYISLLLEGKTGAVNPMQKEFLTHVFQATERLRRLLSDLLNLSKIESGQIQFRKDPVNLGALLHEIIQTFKAQADNKEIQLELQMTADPGQMIGDENRLAEVMSNLVSNALKYTPRKGHVEVSARRDNGQIEIEVKDTGMGIPSDKKAHVFEPFFRVHTSGSEGEESVGLGLALVKEIVERHHGTIRVESQVNKGSSFTVLLPANQAAK